MLVSVAGLTALVSVCLAAFAVRERSTAIKVSLCVGGLSLGLALAIAARFEATTFALNLVISEGGLSGLSSNPQGTYIAGELRSVLHLANFIVTDVLPACRPIGKLRLG
jgi:hypothetical protein